MREKYCWLTGDWWLVLNWCERKALLAGWEPASRTRPMFQDFHLSRTAGPIQACGGF
jgi:hypothetical protein